MTCNVEFLSRNSAKTMSVGRTTYRTFLVLALLIVLGLGCSAVMLLYMMHYEPECLQNDTDEDDLEADQFLNVDNMKTVTIDVGGIERKFVAYNNARRGMKMYAITMSNSRSIVTKYKKAISSQLQFCAYPVKLARKSTAIRDLIQRRKMKLIKFGIEQVASEIWIDTFVDNASFDDADSTSVVICVPTNIPE